MKKVTIYLDSILRCSGVTEAAIKGLIDKYSAAFVAARRGGFYRLYLNGPIHNEMITKGRKINNFVEQLNRSFIGSTVSRYVDYLGRRTKDCTRARCSCGTSVLLQWAIITPCSRVRDDRLGRAQNPARRCVISVLCRVFYIKTEVL